MTLLAQFAATGGAGAANYIEDVFSTWLYTGTGSTQTITNGIDLAGKGGMVWTKSRNNAQNHIVNDTVRGAGKQLIPNSTLFQQSESTALTSFNSNGFSLGSKSDVNDAANTYVSWTFREQPKFFDVVTFTGNGSVGQTIAHNLQSGYGFIAIKRTDAVSDWFVLARDSSGSYWQLKLNSTAANTGLFSADPNISTVFYPSSAIGAAAVNGATYVAYLFAHNAGGFGLTGNDNVISCGSYFGLGATDVNLGWEPQFLLVKPVDLCGTAGDWFVIDNMRGMRGVGTSFPRERFLNPNATYPESIDSGGTNPYGNCDSLNITATGFRAIGYPFTGVIDGGYRTYIYIAIRRGPMKVPTTGTSVFAPVARSGTSGTATITAGFAPDVIWSQVRNYSQDDGTFDKLRGAVNLRRTSTGAEYAAANAVTAYTNTGVTVGVDSDTGAINSSGGNYGNWIFQRAPGFFDEVCWSGNGTGNARNHNLTVYPELVISKLRSGGAGFGAWSVQNNINPSAKQTGVLNTTAAFSSSGATSPTATVFYPTDDQSGATYVTYLFASAPGVSKVGSYTGNGSNQTINCGFTGGARFVMIKRTDSTGDWYVWDSARGIVAGNDPYLLLNSTAAEVTSTDYVDTAASGFELTATAPAAINASGGTFIFLSIA